MFAFVKHRMPFARFMMFSEIMLMAYSASFLNVKTLNSKTFYVSPL